MKKYIQRNATGVPGTKWHSSPRCKAIKPDATVILAPESMLKAYNITEKCSVCEQREIRLAQQDNESDLRPILKLLVSTAVIIEKQVSRVFLRDELDKREVTYNLRETKLCLARKLCKCWFRERDYASMVDIVNKARDHWQDRVDNRDPHKPYYYIDMLSRSIQVIKELEIMRCQR